MSLPAHRHHLESADLLRLTQTRPELEYLFRHALVQAAEIVRQLADSLPPEWRVGFLATPAVAEIIGTQGNSKRAR